MKIVNMICAKGRTGFFFDDQRAIKKGAVSDGAAYKGAPVTDGFTAIRQAGEAISVMLVLEDGQISYGDCAAVQYSPLLRGSPAMYSCSIASSICSRSISFLVERVPSISSISPAR